MSFISKSFLILTDFFTPHLHCICQPDTTNFLNAKHSYCMCVRLTWDFLKKVYPPPPPHHPVRQWQMVISSDRITLERVQQESKVKGDAISLGNFTIISLIRDSSIWPKKTNFPVELDNIETFYCFNGQKVIELWGGGGGGWWGRGGKCREVKTQSLYNLMIGVFFPFLIWFNALERDRMGHYPHEMNEWEQNLTNTQEQEVPSSLQKWLLKTLAGTDVSSTPISSSVF